jgi:hypothetical protein
MLAYMKGNADICTTIINQQNLCLMKGVNFFLGLSLASVIALTFSVPTVFAKVVFILLAIAHIVGLYKVNKKESI